MKYLIYILLPLAVFVLTFTSCDKDDSSYTKGVEGHWVHISTKAEVFVNDPAIRQKVEDYIVNRNTQYVVSYEFKNDKTYYYYQDYSDPIKGIYKVMDKNMFSMDDSRGVRTVVKEDSMIYIVTDMKSEIAKELNIDESVLVKVNAIDTFERGLFTE